MDGVPMPAPTARVLIVEDDAAARRALCTLVSRLGWQVTAVATLGEAMDGLRQQPQCVLLDLGLPDGSGLDLLRRVRQDRLPVRVAVTTGTSDPRLLRELGDLRPEAVYYKPVDPVAIEQWIGPTS